MAPELKLVSEKEVQKKEEAKVVPMKKIPKLELIEAEEVTPTKIKAVPKGVKPIIPTHDGCCMQVCTVLNKEVEAIEDALKIREEELKAISWGVARTKTRRQIGVLTTRITALKDLRFMFKEKGSCVCFEEIKGK